MSLGSIGLLLTSQRRQPSGLIVGESLQTFKRQIAQLQLVILFEQQHTDEPRDGRLFGKMPARQCHRASLRNVLWWAGGGSVIVGPTFIPLDLLAKAGGAQEGLLHVDIRSSEVTVLPHESAAANGDLYWVNDRPLRIGRDPVRGCM